MLISNQLYWQLLGATIEYKYLNVLDSTRSNLTWRTNIRIPIERIKNAASSLKENTEFLENYKPLGQNIALINKSVNDVIVGKNRTLAVLFDLTAWANNLI